jgi:hypothetical protein
MQKAWQAQAAGAKVNIDADFFLKQVRRNQQKFRTTIFWREHGLFTGSTNSPSGTSWSRAGGNWKPSSRASNEIARPV